MGGWTRSQLCCNSKQSLISRKVSHFVEQDITSKHALLELKPINCPDGGLSMAH